jgi:uncharacterized Zn-binding protein involved in type VI secretion
MTWHAANSRSAYECQAHPMPSGLDPTLGPGSTNVQVCGARAVAVGDICICKGTANPITTGNPTVLVNGRPIAREFDFLTDGAVVKLIANGSNQVRVGAPATDPQNRLVTLPPECAFLKNNIDDADSMQPLPQDALKRHRRPFSIGPGAAVQHVDRNTPWEGPRPATAYQVDVGDRKVTVVVEDGTATPGKLQPTPQQVAESLALMPPGYLDSVDKVVISPAPKRSLKKDGTFEDSSVPADYRKKEVYLYPRDPNLPTSYGSRPRTQGDLDWQLLHEVAHGFDEKSVTGPDEAAWANAMTADGKFPSAYARTQYAENGNRAEDFAESVVMYALVRGTPCEAPARQMFPARFVLLDRFHGQHFK